MKPEKQLDTGSVHINYAEFEALPGGGSRYPIVLLHGGSARWQAGLPVISALTVYGPVYALDFRGHGQSGRTCTALRRVLWWPRLQRLSAL